MLRTPVPPKWQVQGALEPVPYCSQKQSRELEQVSCPRASCWSMNQFGERTLEPDLDPGVMRDHQVSSATKER